MNGVSQQPRTVTGKIIDFSGAPLPGVSVVLKGATTGTITDFDGNYTLANVPADATLVFSFVGMKSQEVEVAGKQTINVVLEDETIGIEEVVAVGYGTMRKKDLTGSVASVNSENLKNIPVTSAAQAIVGQLAGVQVTRTEGSPDAAITIRVRGGGSITQDNSPLFVVDGLPVDNINDIAPTDIESIDVLKDASSTAIYGARGANGVILVTTKSGKLGDKSTVSYNTYFGVKQITKTLDVLDPYEFALYQFEGDWLRDPRSTTMKSRFGDFRDIELYKETNGTDWQDELFGRTGTNMYHNLSFSGGTKTSKFNISLTYNDTKEIMLGSGYTTTNLTMNYFKEINNWLSIKFSPRISDSHIKGAGTSTGAWRLTNAIQYRPVNGLMDFLDMDLVEDLSEIEPYAATQYNPVDMTNDDYRRNNRLNVYLNGEAMIKFTKDLTYQFFYGVQMGEDENDNFYGLNTFNTYYTGRPATRKTETNLRGYRVSNTLTYSKRDFFPGHNLTVLIGEELTSRQSNTIDVQATYYPLEIDPVSALSMIQLANIPLISSSIGQKVRVSSYFGRLNYNYKGKYSATMTMRADGSSKFAPGNQWGYFPSVGLGWNISEEGFLKDSSWLSFLKLRASYGEAGNNRISDNAWQKTFSVGTANLYMGADQTSKNPVLLASSTLSNEKLKWETTITQNIGLDFNLFKNRISGTVDAYMNRTKDLLIKSIIPASSGYSNQWQNIGETSNRGIELELDGAIIKRDDFILSASFNIGINKSRIEKLGEVKSWVESSGVLTSGLAQTLCLEDYIVEEGGQVGQMYGWLIDGNGMYSFDDFYYNAETGVYTLKEGVPNDKSLIAPYWFGPGTLKLKDLNGDGIVDAKDKVVLGNANPKHTGGFNLTAQFKGFDCSAYFNWVYGNDIFNMNKGLFTCKYSGFDYKNILNIMNSDNRFTTISKETGEIVKDPVGLAAMNENANMWSPQYGDPRVTDFLIEDGSFLRLNTLTLGYTLPKSLTGKIGIQRLRVYVSGYNLWTWTNYSGYDPEVSTARGTPLTPGIDFQAYPRSREFNVGLNVEF
ncbi:MAG: SusC/RagA family TonB-linked outer membrane protein [Bacteroidetes bacterium GWF2_42_66]|nr:MAG: SusC/RagA family TonB-linked outer membrane protein [Bacteroidetes bacterium GWA2_42_15]OFX98245.1 MAG: SusC/RagA family TonB-linked outer membrane protein [Bacteroidetes bacterium GWE2_42_39]OFY42627.1 MAG: SusC/RagA family TonB-linked outer membrane protein [Bacteroidetes bacterium GWF2_42_66]